MIQQEAMGRPESKWGRGCGPTKNSSKDARWLADDISPRTWRNALEIGGEDGAAAVSIEDPKKDPQFPIEDPKGEKMGCHR
jgi:hypothetical protein